MTSTSHGSSPHPESGATTVPSVPLPLPEASMSATPLPCAHAPSSARARRLLIASNFSARPADRAWQSLTRCGVHHGRLTAQRMQVHRLRTVSHETPLIIPYLAVGDRPAHPRAADRHRHEEP